MLLENITVSGITFACLSTGGSSSADRENNPQTASKNKKSKYGKLYFIEHSSEHLST